MYTAANGSVKTAIIDSIESSFYLGAIYNMCIAWDVQTRTTRQPSNRRQCSSSPPRTASIAAIQATKQNWERRTLYVTMSAPQTSGTGLVSRICRLERGVVISLS
jgi:hypothetical protein